MEGSADSRKAVCLAPAKVNFVLRVCGRRADGYHDIESLMAPVSIYDTVEIEVAPAPRARVSCRVRGPERVRGGRGNLAARAASALLDSLGVSARVSIRLDKHIPFGAGLGGGSSDAGAVLRTLPAMLGRRMTRARLRRVGAGLGADVPFFVDCRPAVATGIGDILTPLDGFGPAHVVVVVPAVRVDTAWAYRHALSGLTSVRSAPNVAGLARSRAPLSRIVANDFEAGVRRHFPDVERVVEQLLERGAEATVLSGSGSATVGIFDTAAAAVRATAGFARPDTAFAARVLRRRPRPGGGR